MANAQEETEKFNKGLKAHRGFYQTAGRYEEVEGVKVNALEALLQETPEERKPLILQAYRENPREFLAMIQAQSKVYQESDLELFKSNHPKYIQNLPEKKINTGLVARMKPMGDENSPRYKIQKEVYGVYQVIDEALATGEPDPKKLNEINKKAIKRITDDEFEKVKKQQMEFSAKKAPGASKKALEALANILAGLAQREVYRTVEKQLEKDPLYAAQVYASMLEKDLEGTFPGEGRTLKIADYGRNGLTRLAQAGGKDLEQAYGLYRRAAA